MEVLRGHTNARTHTLTGCQTSKLMPAEYPLPEQHSYRETIEQS